MAKKRAKKTKKPLPRHVVEKLMALEQYEVNQERGWRKIIEHSSMAGLAVALLSLFFQLNGDGLLLFASLGATAAVMGYFPKSKMNSVRTVILAYLAVILVSIFCWYLVQRFEISLGIAIFIAVFLATASMLTFDIFHPPAISASLGFVILSAGPYYLLLMLVCVMSLVVVLKLIYYIHLEELHVEHFMKEFTKKHYGMR